MKNRLKLLLGLSLLVLVSLACALPFGGNDNNTEGTAPDNNNVLFSDDFSNENSGWDRVSETDYITNYENGIYRINVNVADSDYWANPGKNFKDVRVEVDATKAQGPDDNDFGVLCRYKSVDAFYFFLISSDGYYGIGKAVDGNRDLIGQTELLFSEEINLGLDTNHIRADCVGSELSLYVNDTLIASASDSDYTSGDVGLMAGTFSTVGTDIHFDNFMVYDPAAME
jgi:hypothetical protein